MKILAVESIRAADAFTIQDEPVLSIDLMERAASACMHWLNYNLDVSRGISIFCGMGNNGGDGLAIARMCYSSANPVQVIIINHSENKSKDFEINLNRLTALNVTFFEINSIEEIPVIPERNIIIDAILGSGLNKATEGIIAEVIKFINALSNEIIAIDIPSGLFCDKSNDSEDTVIKANTTLSFQLPKLAFMFPQNNQYIGEWKLLPIKLSASFIKTAITKNYLTDDALIETIYHPRNKTAHKGNFGHALLICGSMGKMGAAVLSAKACLRSGAGLLSLHLPKSGLEILQTAVPEAMCEPDFNEKIFTNIHSIDQYNVIGIGSGIGKDILTQNGFKELLLQYKKPMVIDADAINIIGENIDWLKSVPKYSILTPHFKEFERITKKAVNDFERNQLQRDLSVKHQIYIVLKGAHTAITTPEGDCYFNSSGNPGMATAGSGDVLTGILTGLLAQNYTPLEAAILGVYLHGKAGDLYAEEFSEESLIAGDLIGNIGSAYRKINHDFTMTIK
ncbi:MAG: NAD(P)H-hydrate dehydratase [Bacteroidales bacterium]